VESRSDIGYQCGYRHLWSDCPAFLDLPPESLVPVPNPPSMTGSRFTRRDFLAGAGGMICLGITADFATAQPNSELPPLIIDCHAHLYGDDASKYPPIPHPYSPPPGKGTVAHLRREMRESGVRFATAVQTTTYYEWDNRFIADASRENRDLLAGVCTLDPDDPRSSALLERYVRGFNIRGFRSLPAKNGRLDDPGVSALWSAAERLGIVVNVHVQRDKRREIESLVARHPQVRVVIDHCLYLKAGRDGRAVLADMRALARLPTVYAKLSCAVSGSAEGYPFRDMHEPIRAIIEAFGPRRCVWGSDFPCELWCPKATYKQHLRVFTHEMGLDAETKRHLLGETAKKLYFS